MNKLRAFSQSLSLSLALLCAPVTVSAQVHINDAAAALAQEGDTLVFQQKYVEALRSYDSAVKADPASSVPLSKLANLLYLLANSSGDAEKKTKVLAQAEAVAQEVLRMLSEDKPAPRHPPTDEAAKLAHEGEQLFVAGKFDEAREKYMLAAQADPLYSSAWIYAGDCYFAQKKWREAEALFRKGVEIEPLNSQGWRFLSDALLSQGKRGAAEEALLNGIAAQPSQMPNWGKLARLRATGGTPLAPLGLVRKASATLDEATGKPTINLDSAFSAPAEQKTPDGAVWLMLGMAEANLRVKNRQDKTTSTPFAIELASWESAMKVAEEIAANGGGAPRPIQV